MYHWLRYNCNKNVKLHTIQYCKQLPKRLYRKMDASFFRNTAFTAIFLQKSRPLLSKEEMAHRFQEQWLGHFFAKMFALVVNLVALVMAYYYWDFGTEWEKVIIHGLFGTMPVHIMSIFMLSLAPKYSREMSLIHDYICGAMCTTVSVLLYFIAESETPTSLFMFITAIMLAFDLGIHTFSERSEQ